MLRPLLAAALLLPALAGCDSVLGSRAPEVAGGYELVSAPAVVVENEGARVELLADTLWFYPDGTGRRISHTAHAYATRDTLLRSDQEYGYTVRRGVVEIEFPCGPTALCSGPPHLWGTRTQDGLELRFLGNPGELLEYRRVEP